MAEYAKPVRFSAAWFDRLESGVDPLERGRLASATAAALLARVREDEDPEVVERLLKLAEHDGIDTVAELWSHAEPHSLPGSLWRLYLVRTLIAQRPDETAALYREGVETLPTIHPVVAGAEAPTGPDELRALADTILRGAFTGDFADALERASACCRIIAAGAIAFADDADAVAPERASELTIRASRLVAIAEVMHECAALWRRDDLH